MLKFNKNQLFTIVIISLWIFTNSNTSAQFYSSGVDPASIKWNKIETENFRVVFPDTYKNDAQRIAKVLETVYTKLAVGLKHEPKKVSVLIHSETAYSNGFVSWAPRRMELYPTEHQNMYAQDWIEQLAIHEFRHVWQISMLDTGFTRLLKYVLGEQAIGALLGMYVPLWFLEGDAVATETALTKNGRGRIPSFEQGVKAQVLDKKIYSYDKAVFGSYKDFVPGHYELGYHIVAHSRAKYGKQLWPNVLKNTGNCSFFGFPFTKSINKETGMGKNKLYQQAYNDLKSKWADINNSTSYTKHQAISKNNTSFINYNYPVTYNNQIIAQKNGPGFYTHFVTIDSIGNEKKLFVPGARPREPFSVSSDLLCFTELEPDARWENRTFSNIKLYNIKTGKVKRISKKSFYFSPDLNKGGDKIITIEKTKDYKTVLKVLSTSGDILELIDLPKKALYVFTPKWDNSGENIVCVLLEKQGKYLATYNFKNKEWNSITKPSPTEIGFPKSYDVNNIIYTGSYSGREELYKINIKSKQTTQITSSKYGATYAEVAPNNTVFYSNYSADGYQLVKTKESDMLNLELNKVEKKSLDLVKVMKEQEQDSIDFSLIKTAKDYDVKPYSKWNIFNFHSWSPAFVNFEDRDVSPGVSAVSQNLLGTAVTTVGYNGDSQMKREKYYLNFEYKGWYPVLKLEAKGGANKVFLNNLTESDNETFLISANENTKVLDLAIGTYIPLNLKKGKYFTRLQPSIDYSFLYQEGFSYQKSKINQVGNTLNVVEIEDLKLEANKFSGLEYGLYFHRLLPKSQRDVKTRWGQIFEFKYQHNPAGRIDFGSIVAAKTKFYWPGFFKHHSIATSLSYQYKSNGEERALSDEFVDYYKFGDYYSLSRGYENVNNNKLLKVQLDYEFPLINADFSVPGIMYIKRITSDLYFDYSKTEYDIKRINNGQIFTNKQEFKSLGFELKAETHFFRFLFPFSVGYRYSRLLDLDANKSEFLLELNLSGI